MSHRGQHEDGFCTECGVRLELHYDNQNGEDCESAEAKADAIKSMERMFWGVVSG